jgi:hypothetical protein
VDSNSYLVSVGKNVHLYQAYWCVPTIPELRRLRPENHEFKASLGIVSKKIFVSEDYILILCSDDRYIVENRVLLNCSQFFPFVLLIFAGISMLGEYIL